MTPANEGQFSEHEIKLYVRDLAEVERRLIAAGAPLLAPRVHEVNVRYEDASGSLTPAHQVLRLRRDARVRLTYKDEHGVPLPGGGRTRFEAEVEVSDFAAMDAILNKLGFHPYMTYEKYRTTYALAGAEIALDEMPYGTFVEIEGEPDAISAAVARLALHDAPPIPLGYAVLFERLKAALGLTCVDLTFANFAGVTVPEALILSVSGQDDAGRAP
ncbi:MAG: class IV adenylate cyclase [Candidatus Flexifilum sp.]|jgi:adenylate cyclase class 2